MVGQSIRHYKIIEQIGAGGMGVVYKAEDTRLGRTVALKFFPESLERPLSYRARLEREARAASRLDHPNVATVYSFEEADGECFICMAHVEGESLRERLTRGPLPVKEALRIAIQVADGLAAAHREGIIHLDIKPGNILINRDGVVKIVDFGLARALSPEAESQGGASYASTPYMSPEQAWGNPVDERSDVYSLGVVIYEMLTGRPPFLGDNPDSLLHELLNVHPPLEPLCQATGSAGVDGVVQRCLKKDRKERYLDSAALATDLRNALDTVGVRRDGVSRAGVAFSRPLWTAGIAVVAIAFLSVILWPQRGGDTPPKLTSVDFVQGYGIELFNETLDPGWTWVRENPAGWSLGKYAGYMTIELERGDLWSTWTNNCRNMLLRDAPEGDFAIETHLIARLIAKINQAHLLVYQDDDNYVRFGLVRNKNTITVLPIREVGGSPLPQHHIAYATSAAGLANTSDSIQSIYLRIEVSGRSAVFMFSSDGQYWHTHSVVEALGFTPVKVGLTAFDGSEPPSDSWAAFDYFAAVPPGSHEFRSGDP